MTVTVSPVFLLNVETGQPEAAQLLDSITEKQLADYESEWLPEQFKAVQRLSRAGVQRKHWPQSRHWDWRRKTAALQGTLANPGFSVVCGGLTQGMMLVDTTMKPSWRSGGANIWSMFRSSRMRRGIERSSSSILHAIEEMKPFLSAPRLS